MHQCIRGNIIDDTILGGTSNCLYNCYYYCFYFCYRCNIGFGRSCYCHRRG